MKTLGGIVPIVITAPAICLLANVLLASVHVVAFGYGGSDLGPFIAASLALAAAVFPIAQLLQSSQRSAWLVYLLAVVSVVLTIVVTAIVTTVVVGGPHGSVSWSLPVGPIWYTSIVLGFVGGVMRARPSTWPSGAVTAAILLFPSGYYAQTIARTPDDIVLCLQEGVTYEEADKISDSLFTLDGSSRIGGYLPGVLGASEYYGHSIRVLLEPGTSEARRDELRARALRHPKVTRAIDIPSLNYSSDVKRRHRNVCKGVR